MPQVPPLPGGASVILSVGVLRQPGPQWLGRVEEIDHAGFRRLRAQPGTDRPLAPRDETLLAQQVDAGMILRVAPRRGLQLLVAADLALGGNASLHDLD